MERKTEMAVYACSDIHGQYSLFQKMLEGIRFSEDDKLYILGDLIDRGPESLRVLQDVMQRTNVTCLLGNHELMMNDYLWSRGDRTWLSDANGGIVTLRQYADLGEESKRRVFNFIKSLYFQTEIRVGGKVFLLSHSGFVKNKRSIKWAELQEEDVFSLVWASPWRFWEYIPEEAYDADGRIHVIGHVPVQAIKKWPGKKRPDMPCAYINKRRTLVDIDCGCAWREKDTDKSRYALCVMDLEEFAMGKDAFRYFQ